jgi:thiol-disulfide isomerase/thioredoxin
MKQKIIISAVCIVLLGVGVFAYVQKNQPAPVVEEHAMMDGSMKGESEWTEEEMNAMKGDVTMSPEAAMTMMEGEGHYEAYTPDKLSRAETGKVVLFFKADWCPVCKALDTNIRANLSNIPKGVSVLIVNYDNSTDLKKKYGVTYQHTFVQVDKNGNQIAKWSGAADLVEIVGRLK